MCLNPIKMARFVHGATGEVVVRPASLDEMWHPVQRVYVDADFPGASIETITFLNGHDEHIPYVDAPIELFDVPCGKCVECLQDYSNQWAFRCLDEAKLHEHNCCVTLTYAPEHLPENGSLNKSDLQLFMKRLREHLRKKYNIFVRFRACGEYGSKFGRCHYHIILFGYDFPDKEFWKMSKKGFPIYRSKELEALWQLGFSSIEDLSLHNAKYCSKYLQKLVPVPVGCEPTFITGSNRPGIGFGSIDKSCLLSDKIYSNGSFIKVPRYYLDVLARDSENTARIDEIKKNRVYKAQHFARTKSELRKRRKNLKKSLDKKLVK